MDVSDIQELSKSIDDIERLLGIKTDADLEREYLTGKAWALPAYEKVHPPASNVRAIQKYLIGARSYIKHQQEAKHGNFENFYDIYRAARIVPLVRTLARALSIVASKVQNHESRFEIMKSELELDSFEAVLYELVVAAKYAEHPKASLIGFIDDFKGATGQTPDLAASIDGIDWTIECKKFDRTSDYSVKLRDEMRDLSNAILDKFHRMARSVVVEFTLHVTPDVVSQDEIVSAAVNAFGFGGAVVTPKYTVVVRPLPPYDSSNYTLYPSPVHSWQRFGYEDGGDFHGIVSAIEAEMAGPSVLDEVKWDAAVKWRVLDSLSIWKRNKLGFALMFKGLEQLDKSSHPILHVCYERNPALGARRDGLLKFIDELGVKQKKAGWIIFNEIVPKVSIGGRFDFTEHAHIASGPQKTGSYPPVTAVFVGNEDIQSDKGEFGVGADLPPIDTIEE